MEEELDGSQDVRIRKLWQTLQTEGQSGLDADGLKAALKRFV